MVTRNSTRLTSLPVGVEHDCGVTAKQRDALRELATLFERDDGESTAATGFPINRKVFRVNLDRELSDQTPLR